MTRIATKTATTTKTVPKTKINKDAKPTTLCTAEHVFPGHPDKVCDQVSGAVLDACLKADPKSRVAEPVMVQVTADGADRPGRSLRQRIRLGLNGSARTLRFSGSYCRRPESDRHRACRRIPAVQASRGPVW